MTSPKPPGAPRMPRWQKLIVAASAFVLAVSGISWMAMYGLGSGLTISDILAGGRHSRNGDQNILIMGLDSRLDEQGNPLPSSIYSALHAGDSEDGGYNANVLILLHIPGNGDKPTAISIPRDDYTDLPGCPDGVCHAKIKEAYGLTLDAREKELVKTMSSSSPEFEQAGRDAGRKAEIDTVSRFLGGVPIDHFVEVTLAAFYEVAQVVAPVTVCLNEDTQDSYSGAYFQAGPQELTASEAVAFVRQRRDTASGLAFSDLDRERRQQAFIVSLAHKLEQAGTLTDPIALARIYGVAKANTAIDSGLDPVALATKTKSLTSGDLTFYTLPVDHFGHTSSGEEINVVNPAAIHAIVRNLIGDSGMDDESQVTTTTVPPAPVRLDGITTTVANATGRSGLASDVQRFLVKHGATGGAVGNASTHTNNSVVHYGRGGADSAAKIAGALGGMSTASDSSLAAGAVQVVLGEDFTMPADSDSSAADTTPLTPVAAAPRMVAATASGANAPAATDLTRMTGAGVPCVK